MRSIHLPLLSFILTLLGSELAAQTSSVKGPPAQLTAEMARQLLQIMEADLRNLVTAEEQHFADKNEYGRTLSAVDRNQVFILPSPGVTLTLTYVTKGTWAGRANHEWLLEPARRPSRRVRSSSHVPGRSARNRRR